MECFKALPVLPKARAARLLHLLVLPPSTLDVRHSRHNEPPYPARHPTIDEHPDFHKPNPTSSPDLIPIPQVTPRSKHLPDHRPRIDRRVLAHHLAIPLSALVLLLEPSPQAPRRQLPLYARDVALDGSRVDGDDVHAERRQLHAQGVVVGVQRGLRGVVYCAPNVRHEAGDGADVDDRALRGEEQWQKRLHHSHQPKQIRLEGGADLGRVGVGRGDGVVWRWRASAAVDDYQGGFCSEGAGESPLHTSPRIVDEKIQSPRPDLLLHLCEARLDRFVVVDRQAQGFDALLRQVRQRLRLACRRKDSETPVVEGGREVRADAGAGAAIDC